MVKQTSRGGKQDCARIAGGYGFEKRLAGS